MSELETKAAASFDGDPGPKRLRVSDDGKSIIDARWRGVVTRKVARRPREPWRSWWQEEAKEIVRRFNAFEDLLDACEASLTDARVLRRREISGEDPHIAAIIHNLSAAIARATEPRLTA